MQWKSLVLTLATVGPALARSHGNHKHRHAARHEHATGIMLDEPMIVTKTEWVCCTASALSPSAITPTVPATFIELPTETPSSTETPTPTETPVETSTSTPAPVPTETEEPLISISVSLPEPETTTSSVAPPPEPSTTEAPSSTTTEAPSSTSTASSPNWTDFPSSDFCFDGFGGRTSQDITGNKFTYSGNVGLPWGSNIQEVHADEAHKYKYVVQFHGSKTDKMHLVIWNKIGPDMKMTGWYGNSALTLSLQPEEIRYVAFDENSQGSWGAAKGDSLPTDLFGGYSCTWGEFDLGSEVNGGWSGWDVSAIQAQAADADILGMKMCSYDDSNCSIITKGAAYVKDAYLEKDKWVDGIGGKVRPGAVRIVTHLDYDE